MEAEVSADNKTTREIIIEAYLEYMLVHGKEPASVFSFCKELELEESSFYDEFSDFTQVAEAFWVGLFKNIMDAANNDSEFPNYSAREKTLGFYYNFFEELKKHRSYALITISGTMMEFKKESEQLSSLKKEFKLLIKQILSEGQSNGEIASRSKLNDTYDELFWYQFMFLMAFWRKDKSKGFENTDAAIEKSVNLSFDLIEKNALESAFDFGKFIFQNR